MNPYNAILLWAILIFTACAGTGKKEAREDGKKLGAVLKETLATGDTGLTSLTRFRKTDLGANLCQQWELEKTEGASSSELILDENFDPIHPQYNFFKDGSVLENPRHRVRLGKWRIGGRDSLILSFTDNVQKWFLITSVDSRQLRMITKDKVGNALYLNLSGNGLVHANMYNDPYHPVNNQWRLKPGSAETDSAIKARAINCVKFFALYYRDNLLRNKSSINFEGFPRIFNWYKGGIGLPDRDKLDEKWIDCFYDEDDASKGYKFLRALIVNYEYEWTPKVAWWLQTHSVLEQMYHKAIKM